MPLLAIGGGYKIDMGVWERERVDGWCHCSRRSLLVLFT